MEKLGAIKKILTTLNHSEDQVEAAVTELVDLLYQECTLNRIEALPNSISLQNAIFSQGIVKALLGILRSSLRVSLLARTTGCLALLAHGNDEGRTSLGKMRAIPILLDLLSHKAEPNDSSAPGMRCWDKDWVPVYEQAIITLRKLTYHNQDNQQEFARIGGIKLIVALCMDHNFLHGFHQYSAEAKKSLEKHTLGKKLICRVASVPEKDKPQVLQSFSALSNSSAFLSYPAFYIDLATEDENWITNSMLEEGVVWPEATPFPEDSKWTCVTTGCVEDGAHLWCQFCVKKPNSKIEEMRESLKQMDPPKSCDLSDLILSIGDVYAAFCDPAESTDFATCLHTAQWCRVRLLQVEESSTLSPSNSSLSVLAVDFGFTISIPKTHLANLPNECRGIPPQAIPCKLLGISPLPVSVVILENTAAVLRNVAFEKLAFRKEIQTFNGITAVLKDSGASNHLLSNFWLSICFPYMEYNLPYKESLKLDNRWDMSYCGHSFLSIWASGLVATVVQSLGSLLNLSVSNELRDSLGKEGAIDILLSLLRRPTFSSDLELVEQCMGCLLNLVIDCQLNVELLARVEGEAVLMELDSTLRGKDEKISSIIGGVLHTMNSPTH